MPSDQLNLIRQYCDTTGIRLSRYEKDLLCKVLEYPERYDGFISSVHIEHGEGKEPYHGRYTTCTKDQYRIIIDSSLSIDHIHSHECDDGFENTSHWDWNNPWHITDTRRIIEILKDIESEL